MAKFEVQIFGTVPDCLMIEATSEDEAKDKALEAVLDILEFKAAPAEAAASAEPAKAKCGKARRSHDGHGHSNKR